MSEFKESLEAGVEVENIVLDKIRQKYPCAVRIDGKFKDYDIWIPEKAMSVEVKRDQKSKDTGNYVIELEMFGKKSGVLATKADWWIIFDGDNFLYISPDNIIDCILLNNIRSVKFTGNGDTAEKTACLVPKTLLNKYGTLI